MPLTEHLPIIAFAAAAGALVAWLVYRYLIEFMLERRGTITRGTVLRAVELGSNGGRGTTCVVWYEFSAGSSSGNALMYRGRQWVDHTFRPKDMVVVRYFPRWPRINLISDRHV